MRWASQYCQSNTTRSHPNSSYHYHTRVQHRTHSLPRMPIPETSRSRSRQTDDQTEPVSTFVPASTEAAASTIEGKPSIPPAELVLYITAKRPWNKRRLRTFFRRRDSTKRSVSAYYAMESAKSETMPHPRPEWDPFEMISLNDDFLNKSRPSSTSYTRRKAERPVSL
jgi:hypothetical protein